LRKRTIDEPPNAGGEGENCNNEEPREKTQNDAQVEFHLGAEKSSLVEPAYPRNQASGVAIAAVTMRLGST
jgi:hypothetical protein